MVRGQDCTFWKEVGGGGGRGGRGGWCDHCLVVGWLLNVPATFLCISGTNLLRQLDRPTEIEVSDRTCFLAWPQSANTGPVSPTVIRSNAWQRIHWSTSF